MCVFAVSACGSANSTSASSGAGAGSAASGDNAASGEPGGASSGGGSGSAGDSSGSAVATTGSASGTGSSTGTGSDTDAEVGATDAGETYEGGEAGTPAPGSCGAGDSKMPPEPKIPPACATLEATRNVASGAVPSETFDTTAIQSALTACSAGQAVRLTTSGANNAFVTGPLKVPTGVTLWVDSGVTLYGTRDPKVYGSASALITVSGSNSGIVGDGVIDGQGGEPMIGSSESWWDSNAGSSGNSPALIAVQNAMNFTLYRITLHNSPKFHVKLAANGFVVWGVSIKTPSKAKNSVGTALTPTSAHNTDGIDPGEAASNGYIVCSKITVGDDHIAIKGTTGVNHLTIAHNHFGAGHGMSIGSEFQGGVSNVSVYDLSIDGTGTGLSGGSSNGIRIKSDSSRGGLVNDVTYSDVCVREIANPILLTPKYSTLTGSSIPQYTNITIQNFRSIGSSVTPKVTLDGYDASHMNSITLDNVIIDGISSADVTASYTDVTLGPGNVNFTPSGTSVAVTKNISGSSTPNDCAGKWVTF
jgi:polygalacturonase